MGECQLFHQSFSDILATFLPFYLQQADYAKDKDGKKLAQNLILNIDKSILRTHLNLVKKYPESYKNFQDISKT
ncbi:MAG: hypothetical protein R3Y22_03200 [Bacteroidales bacterium]